MALTNRWQYWTLEMFDQWRVLVTQRHCLSKNTDILLRNHHPHHRPHHHYTSWTFNLTLPAPTPFDLSHFPYDPVQTPPTCTNTPQNITPELRPRPQAPYNNGRIAIYWPVSAIVRPVASLCFSDSSLCHANPRLCDEWCTIETEYGTSSLRDTYQVNLANHRVPVYAGGTFAFPLIWSRISLILRMGKHFFGILWHNGLLLVLSFTFGMLSLGHR